MRRLVFAVSLVALPVFSLVAMPVSTFLPKAEALKKKGAMALFSRDMGLMKREFTTAATQLRNERLAAAKAGGKPAYCPPAKGRLDLDELMGHLRTIPPAQRGMSFKTAYGNFLIKKFPCRAS